MARTPQLAFDEPPPARISISQHPAPMETPHGGAISVSNPLVVRAAVAAASFAFLGNYFFSALVRIPLLPLVASVAGGYGAVWLYQRSSGQALEPAKGARLGWICGWFVALIQLIVTTLSLAFGSMTEMAEEIRQQMAQAYPDPTPEMTQALDLLMSPTGLVVLILVSLVFATLPPALGGFIGARVLGKR